MKRLESIAKLPVNKRKQFAKMIAATQVFPSFGMQPLERAKTIEKKATDLDVTGDQSINWIFDRIVGGREEEKAKNKKFGEFVEKYSTLEETLIERWNPK